MVETARDPESHGVAGTLVQAARQVCAARRPRVRRLNPGFVSPQLDTTAEWFDRFNQNGIQVIDS